MPFARTTGQQPVSIWRWTQKISPRAARSNVPCSCLWGATGGVGRNHNPGPAEIWHSYANNIVAAKAVPSGHYLSDEAPAETTAALREFFAARF